MEIVTEFFTSGEFWAVLIKVLMTALLSAGIGLICTLIGKAIVKHKDSKIYKYAKTCVKAAEQKYPNEGKKMGPEKMAYVMDQMAIKFPKIKENTYFYNIAEAAVLELNKEMKEEAAIKEFEEKYGEKPLAILEKESHSEMNLESKDESIPTIESQEKENLDAPENISKRNVTSKIKSF